MMLQYLLHTNWLECVCVYKERKKERKKEVDIPIALF
jgi:hypothetical protein